MPLTDTAIRSKKPGTKPSKYADGGGLYIEVRPTGTKLWRYRYRIGKAENIFAIGEYFDDKRNGHVSLEQARRARDDARVLVRQGVHPTHQRRQDRLVKLAEATNTFEGVAREWMGKHPDWSSYYRNQIKRNFEVDVFPKIGQTPIREVNAAQLLKILQDIENRGAETVALNVRQWSSAIFRFAVSTLRADSDPAAALKGAIVRPPTKHSRALSHDELKALVLDINGYAGYRTTVIGLHLLLLTFVRTIELRSSRWSDIDLDKSEWRVPAGRMKSRKEHIVPLSRQSVELIKELKTLTGGRDYLFPNYRQPSKFMCATTINRALERLGYAGRDGLGFAAHGFRSTASTMLNEAEFRGDAIERQLAHHDRNKTRASYNRAEYLPERRRMMQQWADYVDQLRSERAEATPVELPGPSFIEHGSRVEGILVNLRLKA